MSEHRFLRFVLHADESGSSAYIPLALVAAPVIAVLNPGGTIEWLMWAGLLALAIWLAACGVLMAATLGRVMARGEVLDDDFWKEFLQGRSDRRARPGRVLER